MIDLIIIWNAIKVLIEIVLIIVFSPIILYIIYKSLKKEKYTYFSRVLNKHIHYSVHDRNSATKTFRLYHKTRFRYVPMSEVFITGTLFCDEDSIETALKKEEVTFLR